MSRELVASRARPVRELQSVTALLQDARELVREGAGAREIRVVVVGVPDQVLVVRTHLVLALAALLHDAICATPRGGRVAITAQPIESDLVCAVYDTGRRSSPCARTSLVEQVAAALGGRVWSVEPEGSHLAFLSIPLYRDAN